MELHEAAVGHGPGSGTEDSCEEYDLFKLSSEKQTKPLEVHLKIEGHRVNGTRHWGCSSLVSESTYKQLWPTKSLQESFTRLHTYTGEQMCWASWTWRGNLETNVRICLYWWYRVKDPT